MLWPISCSLAPSQLSNKCRRVPLSSTHRVSPASLCIENGSASGINQPNQVQSKWLTRGNLPKYCLGIFKFRSECFWIHLYDLIIKLSITKYILRVKRKDPDEKICFHRNRSLWTQIVCKKHETLNSPISQSPDTESCFPSPNPLSVKTLSWYNTVTYFCRGGRITHGLVFSFHFPSPIFSI